MEVWKIIFLSKWLICRFQLFIFQGVAILKFWISNCRSQKPLQSINWWKMWFSDPKNGNTLHVKLDLPYRDSAKKIKKNGWNPHLVNHPLLGRSLCRVHITNKFHTWKLWVFIHLHMGVSENRGTPKSSILIGFSIINHPFWGIPIFGNTHVCWKTSTCISDKCLGKMAGIWPKYHISPTWNFPK